MDNFINLAKKGYEAYSDSQKPAGQQQQQQTPGSYGGNDQFGVTGGAQYNRPSGDNSYGGSSSGYGVQQGGGSRVEDDLDDSAVIKNARKQADEDDDDDSNDSLFANALSFAKTQFGSNSSAAQQPIDESAAQTAHNKAYGQGQASSLSTQSLGMAAAMQAMKMFTGGQGAAAKPAGGNSQSQVIGMALAEAKKLFGATGGKTADGGGQQDVMNSAAGTLMKLMVQSKMSGLMGTGGGAATGGAAGGGGAGGMLSSLASQFLK